MTKERPRLAETLAGDSRKAAYFYERFGITEEIFPHGVPIDGGRDKEYPAGQARPSLGADFVE
jgi:hypothetical protein